MSPKTCVLLGPGFEPGSPAWSTTVSASKIAAIAEVGDYPDREGEMRRMLGVDPPKPVTGAMRRGQVFEPVIRDLFREASPGRTVLEAGGFKRVDEPRFTATPDGLILEGCRVASLLEIKHVGSVLSWERLGVPAHYEAQAQWQMFVTGHEHVEFAVSDSVRLGKLEFRHWLVERDEHMISILAERARDFLDEFDERRRELERR